ncbi:adenylate cyclase type 10 isoform X2 [Erinaceus europaeus]|uniref:Adenylate cyclase type 10 isoform X2 n=1 Tax=Erinaceus europaeus TaxID=9365 RepID=A0ABM3WVG4_ERIEU|nr:adenylate cyclase type 10 isoform X2 [Erinaceus europaeus]
MFGMAYLICNRNECYPLLGRDKEIKYFMCSMKEFLMSNCSQVLMYEGLPGYGKSQMLMEIEYLAQGEDHRTIAIALTKVSYHQSFYTIQILMANVLGLDTCKHYKERQTNLQNKIKPVLEEKFHCLLNGIFHVQFPISREVSKMNSLRKQKQLEALFMRILEQTVKEERIIFIIDEGQFVDSASWAFLEKLIQTVPIFIIMSLSPFMEPPCPAASAIMKNRNTTYVVLGAVQPKDIRNKVCLDLNVQGIPKELDLFLVEGSCGIPYYCEELLKNLDQHRVLVFQPMESEEKTNVTWHNLFKNFTKPTEELYPFALSDVERGEEVCNLASGVRLKNMSPPASLKEISLVQLDSMSLSHQMLVRCAAIIGLTFTTELLFEILPCWNMKMMINALATLVESNVFNCFRNSKELHLALKQNTASHEVNYRSLSLKPTAGTVHGEEEELRELESQVIECHIIRFCKPMMQKTAYELWLKDQKKTMHLKCARFLEENAHRCDHCRSRDFISYHHFTVDIRLNTLDMYTIQKIIRSRGFQTKEETTFLQAGLPKKTQLLSEDFSSEDIRDMILSFFDNTIAKMKMPQEDIIPLESCQCEEILEMVILPLAYHFLALGENNKALYYFLEITSAYLILGDNYMAYIYLNEGERLLKALKKEKSWSQTFESATFYSLKGQIHIEKTRHAYYVNQQVHETTPPGKKRLAQLHLQTTCFSLLWQIYNLNYFFHYKYYGQLAALMQVNTALETQDSFQIIQAYLEYSLYHQLTGHASLWFKYEIMAMEQVYNLPLKGEGIEIVAYVADRLSYNKFFMGHLDLAFDLGSRAHKIWSLLRNPHKHRQALCWLSQTLFLKDRPRQLIQVLGWLWDFSIAEEHIYSKAFFYFICLDIMLYSGFIYRPFEECLEFICQNEDNRILRFQSGILLGLYSCTALWYARLQEWDNFHNFFNRAKLLVPRRTPTALYYKGISRYMECQVLYLQKQIEEKRENAQDSGVELLKVRRNLFFPG